MMKTTKLVPEDGLCPHYGGEPGVVCCCDCNHYIRIVIAGAPEFALCSFAEKQTALQALCSLAHAE